MTGFLQTPWFPQQLEHSDSSDDLVFSPLDAPLCDSLISIDGMPIPDVQGKRHSLSSGFQDDLSILLAEKTETWCLQPRDLEQTHKDH